MRYINVHSVCVCDCNCLRTLFNVVRSRLGSSDVSLLPSGLVESIHKAADEAHDGLLHIFFTCQITDVAFEERSELWPLQPFHQSCKSPDRLSGEVISTVVVGFVEHKVLQQWQKYVVYVSRLQMGGICS